MRTNIDIDDDLLAQAMHAGNFTTKKETVEAGLRLLARQAAYREILKWEGKLKWEGDEPADWTNTQGEEAGTHASSLTVQETPARYEVSKEGTAAARSGKKAARRAGR